MIPADAWARDSNIMEVGAVDGLLGTSLLQNGCGRFLAVTQHEKHVEKIAAEYPQLANHLVCCPASKTVRVNNADVLILSGTRPLTLWHPRNWRHARQVCWRLRPDFFACVAVLICLLYTAIGLLRWSKTVVCVGKAGQRRRLAVFTVRRRKSRKNARYYIPHALGIAGFLGELQSRGVRHAVLRWFESLPHLPAGEDLDLLVDDNDLEAVQSILAKGPGLVPCDLYTVTGLPGSEFRNMPYYPPRLAEAILANAESHKGVCMVPSAEYHFLSLAYHALYHKGEDSGLPVTAGDCPQGGTPDHDYTAVLGRLADELEVNCEITLEGLDRHFAETGWRPPRDMLARLAVRNRWIRQQIGDGPDAKEDVGLGVFIIRERAIEEGRLDQVTSLIEHHGFEIVTTKTLSKRESDYAANWIRGGNWGRGPWKVSGGPPAAAVVVYDTDPVKLTPCQRRRFPGVTNARILQKRKIRIALNAALPASERSNVLHSSDNGREAVEYIQILMPEAREEIEQRVEQIKLAYATDEPVLKTLTRYGRRAKVELIEHQGHLAVKKTYKGHQTQHCLREATALAELSRIVPEVPPLLAADHSSLIMPYYDDRLRYRRSSGKMFPLSAAKDAIEALRKVYHAGYSLIDAHVENVLIDADEGLKLIDFEYCHRYDRIPSRFEDSYDIAGCPKDFDGDLPNGRAWGYGRNWQPYVGLTLDSLLNDPTWLQHTKRAVYYLAHLPRFLPRRIRHYYRCVRNAAAWVAQGGKQNHSCQSPLDAQRDRTAESERQQTRRAA